MKIGYHTNFKEINTRIKEGKVSDIPSAIQIMPCAYDMFPKFEGDSSQNMFTVANLENTDVILHGPYTISMKPNPNKPKLAIDSLRHYLTKCKEFGYKRFVLHVTSVKDEQIVIDFLMQLDEDLRRIVCLENMAHKESFSLEQINNIAKTVGCGVCLDTAHWFSTSHPAVKITELEAIHFNSVFYDRGSHKDLHCERSLYNDPQEHIEELKKLLSMQDHETLERIPIITELGFISNDFEERESETKIIQQILEDSFKMGEI